MFLVVLYVLISCVVICEMRQRAAPRWGPEVSIDGQNYKKQTNMAADERCVPLL